MHALTPSRATCSRKWRATTRLPRRRPYPSGIAVSTVSISPPRTSASRLRRSRRPGMARIVAYLCGVCHPPAVTAASRRTVVAWTLYDFANSAFVAVIPATVYSQYYALAVVGNEHGEGDFWWGLAVTTSMVIVALSSPPLGGIADHGGLRKRFLFALTYLSVAATAVMATVRPGDVVWGWFLAVVGTVGFEGAIVYYNAYLSDLAPPERQGRLSGYGFAVGYLGSAVALAAALPLAQRGDFSGTFLVTAALFGVFAVPAFLFLPPDRRARAEVRCHGDARAMVRGRGRGVSRADQGTVLRGRRRGRHGAGGRAGSGAGVHGRADPAGPRGRALRLLCAVREDRGDPWPPRLRPRLPPDRWQPAHRDRVGRPLLRDRPRPRPRRRRRRPDSRAHARAQRTRATLSGSADLLAAYENAIGTGGINSTSRIRHTQPRTRRPVVSGVTSSSGGV